MFQRSTRVTVYDLGVPPLPPDRAIEFPIPDATDRAALWRLGATVLAACAGEPIAGRHRYRGIQRVLAKNGTIPDARLLRIVRGEPA